MLGLGRARLIGTALAMALVMAVTAQRGLPPKETFTGNVGSNYAQHEDFQESMVSRITLPAGFKISVAATGLGKPRMMALLPDGGLYISRRDVGDVLLLRDRDGDGKFEDLRTVHAKFPGVHGLAVHNGYLYMCANRELKRARINGDGSLQAADTFVKNLPDGGQHPNRTIAFDKQGMLYITVGSTCNDCVESNAENATILQVAPNGARRIYARGLRNTIGFDWHPQTGALWGADHGTDWRGDDIPNDELNQIKDSAHYGWPWVWMDRKVDPTREDPMGTTKDSFALKTEGMVLPFPAHSAPIGFSFLMKAATFPADMQDDVLVAMHGSWNRTQPDGFSIKRIRFENGQPQAIEDFATGWYNKSNNSRFGRPCGLLVSPKGVVYVTDDANGVLYAITATNSVTKK